MKYTLLINKTTGARAIRLNETGEKITELENPVRYAQLRKRAKTNRSRAIRDDMYRSYGLVKTPYGWE